MCFVPVSYQLINNKGKKVLVSETVYNLARHSFLGGLWSIYARDIDGNTDKIMTVL